MGDGSRKRFRGRPAAVVLLAAALLLALALAAPVAGAFTSFDAGGSGIPACDTCHSQATVHAIGGHASQMATPPTSCTASCHLSGTATPPPPSACADCHGGPSAVLGKATHATTGCGTTPGCHGVPTVTKSKISIKLVGLTAGAMKLGRYLTVKGVVAPAHAAKVTFTFQRKVGTKWVKMKVVSRTSNATSGAYSYKYKPTRKGPWRVKTAAAKTAAYTSATTLWKTFRVK